MREPDYGVALDSARWVVARTGWRFRGTVHYEMSDVWGRESWTLERIVCALPCAVGVCPRARCLTAYPNLLQISR